MYNINKDVVRLKGLYIHIPFCESICHYCDFIKSIPKNMDVIDEYLLALKKEILTYEHHFDSIDTIYIGGGTPSMLNLNQLVFLFEVLKDIHPKEYTIEVNPESYSVEKGLLFKKYGVDRISLGVQTFNSSLLKYLNRKHTNQQVYEVVNSLKEIGIEKINVDIIYGIPGQTLDDLKDDLHQIRALDIKHVSCYSLILEEKTYFYHLYKQNKFHTIDQDIEALMYGTVIDELKKQGFEHYEISNFAKNNKYSIHNLIYWTLDEYIGVGLGSHGFIERFRTHNHHILSKYLKSPQNEKIFQDKETLLQDELIFGLRKIKGVSLTKLKEKYDLDIFVHYPQIKEKIDIGLLKIEGDRLMLTEKGLFLGNQVFMIFI
ncbi:MAG: radical SAM family heme chaperone HemW [Acholeplasmataceae bacterium]|nr:radical SAM family heme chaperone HemW [Acholeplasmataceae bacterium]